MEECIIKATGILPPSAISGRPQNTYIRRSSKSRESATLMPNSGIFVNFPRRSSSSATLDLSSGIQGEACIYPHNPNLRMRQVFNPQLLNREAFRKKTVLPEHDCSTSAAPKELPPLVTPEVKDTKGMALVGSEIPKRTRPSVSLKAIINSPLSSYPKLSGIYGAQGKGSEQKLSLSDPMLNSHQPTKSLNVVSKDEGGFISDSSMRAYTKSKKSQLEVAHDESSDKLRRNSAARYPKTIASGSPGYRATQSGVLSLYPGWRVPSPIRIKDDPKVLFFRMGGEVSYSVKAFLISRGWIDISEAQPHPTDPRPGTILRPSHPKQAGLSDGGDQQNIVYERIVNESDRPKRDADFMLAVPRIWNLWWDDYGGFHGLYGVLKHTQMSNHIVMGLAISRKDVLAESLEKCIELFGPVYDFSPRTFRLPKQNFNFRSLFRKEIEGIQKNTNRVVSASRNKESMDAEVAFDYEKKVSLVEPKLQTSVPDSADLIQNPMKTRRSSRRLWIHKPSSGSRGTGIYLFSRFKEFQERWKNEGCLPCVVQEYIRRPMLVGGYTRVPPSYRSPIMEAEFGESKPYKFDLRLYVLVKSIWPFEVYIHRRGLVRFSSKPYNVSDPNDRLSHLTNFTLNRKSKLNVRKPGADQSGEAMVRSEDGNDDQCCGLEGDDSSDTLIDTADKKETTWRDLYNYPLSGPSGCKWAVEHLWRYLSRHEGVDVNVLWQEIKHIALLTALMTIEGAVEDVSEESANGIQNYDKESATSSPHLKYELWGMDILLDSNAVPYLIEMNRSPAMLISTPADQNVKPKVLHDVFNFLRIEEQLLSRKAGSKLSKNVLKDCDKLLLNPNFGENIAPSNSLDQRCKNESTAVSPEDRLKSHDSAAHPTSFKPTLAWKSYLEASLSVDNKTEKKGEVTKPESEVAIVDEDTIVSPDLPVNNPATLGPHEFDGVFPLSNLSLGSLGFPATQSALGKTADQASTSLHTATIEKVQKIMLSNARTPETIRKVTQLLVNYVSQWNQEVFGTPMRGSAKVHIPKNR